MTKTFSILIVLIFTCTVFCYGQRNQNIKSTFKDDITFLKKLPQSSELSAIILELEEVVKLKLHEIEEQRNNDTEIDDLFYAVRNIVYQRDSVISDTVKEKEISDLLLKKGHYSQIIDINILNTEWTDSQRSTYSYYEFDALVKTDFNKCILINGYYKLDYSDKSRNKDQYGQNIPYVYVTYDREINCNNIKK